MNSYSGNLIFKNGDGANNSVDGSGSSSTPAYVYGSKTLINKYPRYYTDIARTQSEKNPTGLFNGDYGLKYSYTNGGNLFQQDADGYYWYDSSQNAAYATADGFTVYNFPVNLDYRINNQGKYYNETNFLPFNNLLNSDNPPLYAYTNSNNNNKTEIALNTSKQKVNMFFGMMVEFNFVQLNYTHKSGHGF